MRLHIGSKSILRICVVDRVFWSTCDFRPIFIYYGIQIVHSGYFDTRLSILNDMSHNPEVNCSKFPTLWLLSLIFEDNPARFLDQMNQLLAE